MRNPKVLVLDIETSPLLVHTFGLKDQNIGLNQIVRDWHIMCFSAKWLGKPGIIYKETRMSNDKEVVKALWSLLDEADILITQNGKRFDGPKIEARMMLHHMKPPSPYKHLDTYLSTKPRGFTSHKLEYLTSNLNAKFHKTLHSKYPGMSLWTECLKGNNDAWKHMKKYNIQDVRATEELYKNIKPWIHKSHPSPAVPIEDAVKCRFCSSFQLRSLGIQKGLQGKYRRYMCTQCGKCNRGPIYE